MDQPTAEQSLRQLEPPSASGSSRRTGPTESHGQAVEYFQLYSDERGVCRVYEMTIGDGEWQLWREGEPFAKRFTATFSDNGNTITGRWEIAEDGKNYTPDFDLVCRRVGT
jgi:hypothetical protein